MSPVIEGLLLGLGTVLFFGPVFFLLLKSSVQHGTASGLAVATGITASDIACLIICYQFSPFIESESFQWTAALIGVLILTGLGLKYLFSNNTVTQVPTANLKHLGLFFSKGFAVNFFNPFVFAVWLGFIVYGKSTFATEQEEMYFLGSIVVGILLIDIVKVLLSRKIEPFLKPKTLQTLFKGVGILLLLFALRLLVYLVWH